MKKVDGPFKTKGTPFLIPFVGIIKTFLSATFPLPFYNMPLPFTFLDIIYIFFNISASNVQCT